MKEQINILGSTIITTLCTEDGDESKVRLLEKQGKLFCTYINPPNGIDVFFKKQNEVNMGLIWILFYSSFM